MTYTKIFIPAFYIENLPADKLAQIQKTPGVLTIFVRKEITHVILNPDLNTFEAEMDILEILQ